MSMKNPYFNKAFLTLQQEYQLDMIHDVLLGKSNRMICYAEIKDPKNVFLSIISGTFKMIGMKDHDRIRYEDILQCYDPNNSYAKMASVEKHLDYIRSRAYAFSTESTVTLPIITDQRRWITIDVLPIDKTKDIVVVFITEVTEAMNQEEQNYEKSHQDPLTGLFNKYALDFHYGERYLWPHFHVLYLDLDDFKRINDTYGHNFGNLYLKAFADILASHQDHYNMFYRVGGDEFVGLFWGTTSYIKDVAKQIIYKTKNIRFEPDEEGISVSIGIIKANQREDVIRKADKVLYEVKGLGKDQYRYVNE